jgi:hypothetical protein
MKAPRSMVRLALCATMLGGLALAEPSVASADSLLLVNSTRLPVTFAFADADEDCRNGTRDHGWFPVGPNESRGVFLDLGGLVFAAAYTFDWSRGLTAVLPKSHLELEHVQWSMPLDESRDGQCSEIVRVDPNLQSVSPSALWVAQWPKGIRCIPSVHGGDLNLVVQAFEVPEDPSMVMFEFFCFGGAGTPSVQPPVADPRINQ